MLNKFSIVDNSKNNCSAYELLSLSCFSTRNLKIYSEGMAKTRLEKLKFIAEKDIVKQNLHVCIKKDINCGICHKCMRTILMLDAINKLNDFDTVFDLNYYKEHKKDYYSWLYNKLLQKDDFGIQIYKKIKKQISLPIKISVFLQYNKKLLFKNLHNIKKDR